jgi:hypothetical protein
MVKKIWGTNWREKMNIEKKWNEIKKEKKNIYFTVHINSKIDGMQPIYFSIEYVESLWWGIDDSGLRRWENSW